MSQKLQQAASAIMAGEKGIAYKLLVEVIKADPRSKEAERAWVLMSAVVADPSKKRKSLETALSLNPNNEEARRRLARLDSLEAKATTTASETIREPLRQEIAESSAGETKTCPYCAETIKAGAIVCRFCGRDLTGSAIQAPAPQARSGGGSDIKDVTKTTAGVALGILSAPVIAVLIIAALCFGCFLLVFGGTGGSSSRASSSSSRATLPATYTPRSASGSSISSGSLTSGDIPVTRQQMVQYFERSHSFRWVERPRHVDGTYHWSGWEQVDGPKLVLWSEPSDEEDLKEMAYSFAFSGDDSEEEISEGNRGLFDTLALVLPSWDGRADWIVDAYEQNRRTDREAFHTEVNGLNVYLDMGPETTTGNYIVILTISE